MTNAHGARVHAFLFRRLTILACECHQRVVLARLDRRKVTVGDEFRAG